MPDQTLKPVESMTADELRREIAERKGWTDLHVSTGFRSGQLFARQPEYPKEPRTETPDWPRDLNAAWKLWDEMREHDCDIAIESCGAAYVVHFIAAEFEGRDTDPKLAICRAWLTWKRGEDSNA